MISEGICNAQSHRVKPVKNVYLMKLCGLVVGVVCLDDGVRVPSSCSLSVSMVEWLSGVVAPLP